MNKELCVWVVDDDENYRGLLARILGMEMSIATPRDFGSATALLSALKNDPAPTVILMDIQMPGMTGIEAIPLVHQLAPLTKVVIITTFFDGENRELALGSGAVNFLSKRSSPGKMAEAILCAVSVPQSVTDPDTMDGVIEDRL